MCVYASSSLALLYGFYFTYEASRRSESLQTIVILLRVSGLTARLTARLPNSQCDLCSL
jgi:hypothetical protein